MRKKYFILLENDLKNLKRGSLLYKILKNYLKPLGYWRNKRRGKPDLQNLQSNNSALEGL